MLEFWPDYGSGPLWTHGAVISPSDVDVDPSLAERLIRWNLRSTARTRFRWMVLATQDG